MNSNENNVTKLKYLAILYGSVYFLTGILGIIYFMIENNIQIFIDPIEQLILVLTGVIFLRGYTTLKYDEKAGKAFVFVGTILGIILGIIAFSKLIVIGVFGGILNESILSNFIERTLFYLFNPTLILGFLVFLPHKMIKYNEGLA